MRSQHDASRLFAAAGRHDDPVADKQIIPLGSEVIDATGISEPHTDDTFRRRDIVDAQNRVALSAATLTDLLSRFEPALEALPRTGARLLD